MRTDELVRGLVAARDLQTAADGAAGRHGVARKLRRQRLERSALLALVALFVVVVGWAVLDRGEGEEPRFGAEHGEVPWYVPGWLPTGAVLVQAAELPFDADGSTGPARGYEQVAWTDDHHDLPTAGARVVTVLAASPDPAEHVGAAPEVRVDGGSTSVAWTDDEGRRFLLSAVGFSAAEAEDLAASARVGPGGVAVDLPGGFREVHRQAWTTRGGGPPTSGAATAGWAFELRLLDGEVPTGAGTSIDVVVAELPESALWTIAALAPDGFSTTEVRGRHALVVPEVRTSVRGTATGGTTPPVREQVGITLTWWDGAYTSVAAETEAQARAVAEGLERAGHDRWLAYAATAEHDPWGGGGRGPATTVGGGGPGG